MYSFNEYLTDRLSQIRERAERRRKLMNEVLDENERNNNEQKMELSKPEEMTDIEGLDEHFSTF